MAMRGVFALGVLDPAARPRQPVNAPNPPLRQPADEGAGEAGGARRAAPAGRAAQRPRLCRGQGARALAAVQVRQGARALCCRTGAAEGACTLLP